MAQICLHWLANGWLQIFYANVDSCNANIEMWLGLGPMHVREMGLRDEDKCVALADGSTGFMARRVY